MIEQQLKNRIFIVGIFSMSIIPFLIAWGLSGQGGIVKGQTNKGELISPVVTTEASDFIGFDAFSSDNIGELKQHWLMVNVIPQNTCPPVCLEALLKTKQLRLMLGKDLLRTRRLALVLGDLASDKASQLWLKDTLLWRLKASENPTDAALYLSLQQEDKLLEEALVARLLAQENRELALRSELIRAKPSAALAAKLKTIRKGEIPNGMLFIIDPLGNVMMQYEPGFDPYKVKSDLMHLLKISQIG